MKYLAPVFLAVAAAIIAITTSVAGARGAFTHRALLTSYLYAYGVAVLVFILAGVFFYLQGREAKRERERQQIAQRQRERTPPEIYNVSGEPRPIRITGSQHSVKGPFVDGWGGITVVNPTQAHMKIIPQRLVIDSAEWLCQSISFHLRSDDREGYDRISMMGNEKRDYNLHFLFPEDRIPHGMAGELWLTSSNRDDEPFAIPISFA